MDELKQERSTRKRVVTTLVNRLAERRSGGLLSNDTVTKAMEELRAGFEAFVTAHEKLDQTLKTEEDKDSSEEYYQEVSNNTRNRQVHQTNHDSASTR